LSPDHQTSPGKQIAPIYPTERSLAALAIAALLPGRESQQCVFAKRSGGEGSELAQVFPNKLLLETIDLLLFLADLESLPIELHEKESDYQQIHLLV
jgi:hypothetical protein